jgi:hypothetical protein
MMIQMMFLMLLIVTVSCQSISQMISTKEVSKRE